MKCSQCGFENKKDAKFCTKCGSTLEKAPVGNTEKSDVSKYIIIALVAVILLLVGAVGYFALSGLGDSNVSSPQNNASDAS